jgi:hypothetical protein
MSKPSVLEKDLDKHSKIYTEKQIFRQEILKRFFQASSDDISPLLKLFLHLDEPLFELLVGERFKGYM